MKGEKDFSLSDVKNVIQSALDTRDKKQKQIYHELENINKNLVIHTKAFINVSDDIEKKSTALSKPKDFVRREDLTKKSAQELADIKMLMKENNKLQKNKITTKGILGMLGNFATGAIIAAVGGGLLGWLLTGDDKYATTIRDIGTKVGDFIYDGVQFGWKKLQGWYDTGGGKEITGFIGKVISDNIMKGVESAWDFIKRHKTEAIMGGLLGAILTGNGALIAPIFGLATKALGGLLTGVSETIMLGLSKALPGIGGMLGKLVASAIANPQVTGVIGASIFTTAMLTKLGFAIADGIEARQNRNKLVDKMFQGMNEGQLDRAKRLNFTDTETEYALHSQKLLNTIADIQGTGKYEKMSVEALSKIMDITKYETGNLAIGGGMYGQATYIKQYDRVKMLSDAQDIILKNLNQLISKKTEQQKLQGLYTPPQNNLSAVGENLDYDSLKSIIKLNEGLKYEAYPDMQGMSIGYGHYIKKGEKFKEISLATAETLFEKDFQEAVDSARNIPGFASLNSQGQMALIDMTYNMGANWWEGNRQTGVGKWKNLITALENQNYQSVIDSIEDSKYATDIGRQSTRFKRNREYIMSNVNNTNLPNRNIPNQLSEKINKDGIKIDANSIEQIINGFILAIKTATPNITPTNVQQYVQDPRR